MSIIIKRQETEQNTIKAQETTPSTHQHMQTKKEQTPTTRSRNIRIQIHVKESNQINTTTTTQLNPKINTQHNNVNRKYS